MYSVSLRLRNLNTKLPQYCVALKPARWSSSVSLGTNQGASKMPRGVLRLGAAIGTGRTQIHRKLKALTGQSPGEGIWAMRLHRALLQARTGTVAGVACQVGYGSPAHFSTAFSRQFGYPPSVAARYAEVG